MLLSIQAYLDRSFMIRYRSVYITNLIFAMGIAVMLNTTGADNGYQH
ncbi:hypothetical protein NIES25_35260 [Nostoc linckia NIES-25]|nr:hypothetical protein NIES25_35260 [Nostoc linckia NIES-25]